VSVAAVRLRFAYTQARVQARCGALPTEADWRRISGTRGLGAWLEEARAGPLKDWVKGFSAASDVHDIEAGVRNLLLTEIDAVAGFVPERWRAAVRWTRWLPLLGALEHLRTAGELPRWARRTAPVAELLDDAGMPVPRLVERAGIAPLLSTDVAEAVGALWLDAWRRCWPVTTGAVRADLEALAGRLAEHLGEFRRSSPGGAWTLRQQLRERLRFHFHGLGLSPAMPFAYLALVALDLERLRRALLDRALFPEMPPPASAPARAVVT
jgi:hypothetical protein